MSLKSLTLISTSAAELNAKQPVVKELNLSSNTLANFSGNTIPGLQQLDISIQRLSQVETRCFKSSAGMFLPVSKR